MGTRRTVRLVRALLLLAAAGVALESAGFTVKEARDRLDALVFAAPELRVVESGTPLEDIRERVPDAAALDRLLAELGPGWQVLLDQRRGVPSLLTGGAVPVMPGAANDLPWSRAGAGCRANRCIPVAHVEAAARDLLARHPDVFGVPGKDLVLDPDGSGPFGSSIYLLRFGWKVGGVPVEGASIWFRFNGGNLIQIASEGVGSAALDPVPSLTADAARKVVDAYLGSAAVDKAELVDDGSLRVVPVTPSGVDADRFAGPVGSGVAYRLVWRVAFVRPGVVGTWEALVDAHTGELLRFVDANRYGRIHGGAYPGDDHVGEADRPFPFADTGLPAPNQYADAGGLFPGSEATTTLHGKYTWVNDACGPIAGSTADGDLDFLLGPGTDCEVPPGNTAGAGNTHSTRTQYYQLTNVNIKARTYMPDNSWLNTSHINVNVNGNPWCNATSGGGTLSFYRADSGCWNLGEIPSVALHEWGHSMDDFDGSGGDSPPLETRADWTSVLQLHDSCLGRGFFLTGNCGGYGDPCTACNGVRDADYTAHQNQTPWSAANHGTFWNCSGGSYYGPCGLGDHCESGISTQALWEFVTRDLVTGPDAVDLTTAWQLADRLFYTAMPTIGNMYSCTPPTSNGCNGASLYATMMAIDDDGDGTANGTPHAAAIYAALARHNIACGAADDPQNQNQTSCPTLAVGTPVGEASNNSALLSWPASAGATRYAVYRNDAGCDAGFTRVGEVAAPSTAFTDTTVVNGIEYFYRLQALTDNDACFSPMSACISVTPQPCAGSVRLDRSTYSCDDTLTIDLVDSDLTGAGSHTVGVSSDSETIPEVITLIESPPTSGRFSGTLGTTTATTAGDTLLGVADGDVITVSYLDTDWCGTPDVEVTTTAAADCRAPAISAVTAENVTGFSADVSWTTDEAADSEVTYDTASPPAAGSAGDPADVTAHAVRLLGLAECTDYFFTVASTDPAGNRGSDDNGGAYHAFTTGKNTQPTYEATGLPLPITDNSTVTSTITVTDAKTVLDVDVTLNITHTYDGDLDIHLIGPNGVEVELTTDNGGSGENFVDTVFDDEAAVAITEGSAPFTGSFRPETPLSALDGLTAAGDWTLRVRDDAGGDTGTLDGWSLTLLYPAEVCPEAAGWIKLDEAVYGCSATIGLTVQDADLAGTGSVDVEVLSDTESTPETVGLAEVADQPGVFVGSLPTTGQAASAGDGLLSLATGDTITGRYVDADDGAGGSGVTVTDTAAADCHGPLISGVAVGNVTGHSAEVSWTTSEAADAAVHYGVSTPSETVTDATMALGHLMGLEGLAECTSYGFYVTSADEHANLAMDDNGGALHWFTTGANDAPSYDAPGLPVPIPDATPAGVVSAITVEDASPVVDVDVRLNVTHTYDGDLDIFLIGPDGTRVELTTDNGGTGENFVDTVFDDEATDPITGGSAPFTGSFRPESPLSALDGISAAGDWTLEITDDAGSDVGTLDGWTLMLTLPTGTCTGIFSDGFETCSCEAWSNVQE